jgi:hypothetical protein
MRTGITLLFVLALVACLLVARASHESTTVTVIGISVLVALWLFVLFVERHR